MKRFGLLILVAVFWSGLSIGTFNIQAAKGVLSENTYLVSALPKAGTLLRFNHQRDIDFSDDAVISHDNGCLTTAQTVFFNSYHQRYYLHSFHSNFDNNPFSRIFRSSV